MVERNIIEECRKGNLQQFRKLIELSSPYAFSIAFRMVGDEDDASDIVQETMITIWEKIGKIKSPESYKVWLYRIVLNKCYDWYRTRKRNPEMRADNRTWMLIAEKVTVNPATEMENNEIAMIIRTLTEKLSPKQKAVFILGEIEEMPYDEISRITGMGKANIKSNIHYARKNIGEMLNKYI